MISTQTSKRIRILNASIILCTSLSALFFPIRVSTLAGAQQGLHRRSDSGDLECETYCSPTQPGVGVIEVSVRLANRQLNEAELRPRVLKQGLEVTVYSDGFQRGLYATVSSLRPKARFVTQTRAANVAWKNRIPGLDKLLIHDVATRLDKSASSFLLLQQPSKATAHDELVVVRLMGLDPGMDYSFRVPGRGPVICQAPVCPADMISERRNKPRSKYTKHRRSR